MSGMAPDKGAGVVPIVYMTFLPFVGGVHSMVTFACSIPYTMLLTITSRGGPGYVIMYNNIKGASTRRRQGEGMQLSYSCIEGEMLPVTKFKSKSDVDHAL